MSSKRLLSRLATAAAMLAFASAAQAYVFILDDSGCVSTWREGTIPMQVKLATTPALTDGANFRSSVLEAMSEWNSYLGTVQFAGQGMAPGAYSLGNGSNEVVMDSTIEGEAFDQYTLAVTIRLITETSDFIIERDIVINTAHSWDSFRGPKSGSSEDIRRVVSHELGHVLGLDHPNEDVPPQFVIALMNSTVSYWPSIEGPQSDDVSGAQALYGSPGFVPLNDRFANAIAIDLSGEKTTAGLSGTNVAAGAEPGEPSLDPDDPGGRTVWWKWNATAGGTLTVTTVGSNFDTLLGAYSGSTVNSLTQLALNDDVESGVQRQSTITFAVEYGTTYYFAVDGWGGYVGSIQLNLSLERDPNRSAPIFSPKPGTRSVFENDTLSIDSGVVQTTGVSYEWKHNGITLGGETGRTLGLVSVARSSAGLYELTATNAFGTSKVAFFIHVAPQQQTLLTWGDMTQSVGSFPSNLGPILRADIGGQTILALRADRTVSAFRPNPNMPTGLDSVVDVAGSGNHSIALLSDGKVMVWGTGSATVVPDDLKDVIAIASGEGSCVALRADLSVITWGVSGFASAPEDLNNVIAVAAGYLHFLALRSDGTVVGWGYSGDGEADPPTGLNNVVSVAAGGTYYGGGHSLALRSDGTVVAWGSNSFGQCNVPAGLSDVISIAAGERFSLALKSDGTIVGWGSNSAGQLVAPSGIGEIVGIDAGWERGMALVRAIAPTILTQPQDQSVNEGDTASFVVTAAGTPPLVYRWKRNGVVLTDGSGISGATTPRLTIDNVQVGFDGTIVAEVSNAGGTTTSNPAQLVVGVPSEITTRPASANVVEGQPVSFTVAASGGPFTYAWKHNRRLIVGANAATLSLVSATPEDAGYYEVLVSNSSGGVATSVFYLHVAVTDPALILFGNSQPPAIEGSVSGISLGGFYLVVKGDGTVVSWTYNTYDPISVPPGQTDVVAASAGGSHGALLKSDGTVVGFGSDSVSQASPPPGLSGVVAIASGSAHNIALRSNGTVVTWGNPNGVDPYRTNPPTPAGLKNVVAVRCTGRGYLALRSDGSVVSWGTEHNSPVPNGLTDAVDINGGVGGPCALRLDGKVVYWGGYEGLVVADVSDVVRVNGRIALKADGTVVEWQPNPYDPMSIPAGLNGVLAIASDGYAGMALARRGPPVVKVHPTENVATVGDYLVITSKATGTIPLNYQWRRNGVNLADGNGLSGSKTPTLVLDPVRAADDGAYDVVVTNSIGSAVSDPGVLTVRVPPIITKRPLTKLAAVGDAVTFAVEFSDPGPVSILWKHKGKAIPGATGSSLTIGSASFEDAGYYTVEISNPSATAHSTFALHLAPTSVAGVSVAAWGYTYSDRGVFDVPSGIENPVGIAIGEEHVVVLQGDGTLRTWGLDAWGALNPPAGLSDVVAVSAGSYNTLALKADGTVVSFGSYYIYPPPVPKGLRRVVAIATHGAGNAALKEDGTVVTWGFDPAPSDIGTISALAAGPASVFAVRSDGGLRSWGSGQTGNSIPPGNLGPVSTVAFGYSHGVALRQDRTVVVWGEDSHGEAGVPSGLSDVVGISAGNAYSLALKGDGTVVAWGDPGIDGSGTAPAFGGIAMIRSSERINVVLTTAKVAPEIVMQPQSVTGYQGGSVSFRAGARGVPAPTLQWQKNGVDIPGATGKYLWANGISESAHYRVVATNPVGSVVSEDAWLNMVTSSSGRVAEPEFSLPPVEFTQPLTVTISTLTPGATIRYATDSTEASASHGTVYSGPITITGSTTLTAIAYKEGLFNSYVASVSYTFDPQSSPKIVSTELVRGIVGIPYSFQLESREADGSPVWSITQGRLPNGVSLSSTGLLSGTPVEYGAYGITAKLGDSDADSSSQDEKTRNFTMYVDHQDYAPESTYVNVPTGIVGESYAGTLRATGGNGPLRWRLAAGSLPPGLFLTPSGDIAGVPTATTSGMLEFRVDDGDSSIGPQDEAVVRVELNVDAADTVPQVGTTTLSSAGLSIAYSQSLIATGSNGRSWWSKASGSLPPGLTLSNTGKISGIPTALGTFNFTVAVADNDTHTGFLDEGTRSLSITVLSAPRLTNVSMRAFAGTGDDTLVVGFHIAGTGQKTVLIRGVGPKLLDHNVPSVVADPSISLYDSDKAVLATNSDWDASLAPVFVDAGAFPLNVGSKDAAMTATLAPGGYTIHLVNNGPVAEALIEVYDISRDPGTRLVNVSSRLRFQPGQLAILGTAVTGGPLSVLARNVGPGIAGYLVNPLDALPDPHLRLYANQTELAVNEDWDPALLPFFASTGAFAIDEGSKDAAIRAQFQLGLYSVHATGNGGQGVAIIEIYESP